MVRNLTRAARRAAVIAGSAAAVFALAGSTVVTPALASANAPAPPVRLAGVHYGPLVGGTDYYIVNVQQADELTSNGGNQRMTLGGDTQFIETGNAMSYDGSTWYQWEDGTRDGYCVQTSSTGAAHLIMAPCSISSLGQYFWNGSLSNSLWLSLGSTESEGGSDYGVWAENSTAVAVNLVQFGTNYDWNFEKA